MAHRKVHLSHVLERRSLILKLRPSLSCNQDRIISSVVGPALLVSCLFSNRASWSHTGYLSPGANPSACLPHKRASQNRQRDLQSPPPFFMCRRFWYDHIHLSRKNFANVQSANCPGLIQPAAEMPVSSVGPWCESRSTPNLAWRAGVQVEQR